MTHRYPWSMGAQDDVARRRERMIQDQLRGRGIRDERVLAAMAAIPRERFVEPGFERRAYSDEAVPIADGQTISQPYMVARMTELLAPREGERILELGVVPSAVNLARLVQMPEMFDAQALFALEPHYVRASAAELNPKFPAPTGPAPTARIRED